MAHHVYYATRTKAGSFSKPAPVAKIAASAYNPTVASGLIVAWNEKIWGPVKLAKKPLSPQTVSAGINGVRQPDTR